MKKLIPWSRSKKIPARTAENADPLTLLRRGMDELFDGFLEGFGGWRSVAGTGGAFAEMPRVDLSETDTAFEVTADMPGLDKQDVQVTLDGQLLRIAGEKRSERDDRRGDWLMSERSYGRFERVLPLPAEVDAARVKAVFKKGVLRLELPKLTAESSKRKRIAITAG